MTVFKKKEHLPEADSLERSWVSEKVPYYPVGDKAFSLVVVVAYLPLPGHTSRAIFNFHLKGVIQKAFGVLSAYWRIFIRPIQSIANDSPSSCCSRQLLMPDKLLGICAGGFVDWYDSTGKLKEGE